MAKKRSKHNFHYNKNKNGQPEFSKKFRLPGQTYSQT